MQPLLTSDHPPIGTKKITLEQISWLGSINFIGSMVGTLFWGISADRLGRKYTSMIVAIPFIVSWILVIFAQDFWWLFVARVIVGVGCSGAMINTPIYVAEMAEDKIRGSLGSFLAIFMVAGGVFSYIVGSITTYHGLAVVCLSIPITFIISFSCLPESPIYLWNVGKKEAAEKSLLWFRGGNYVQVMKEIEVLKGKPVKPQQTHGIMDLFKTLGLRRAVTISTGFIIGQQCCGILAIWTYTVKIFQDAGSSLTAHNSMIVVGTLQLISSLISSYLVDRAGRRVLLLSSYMIMALSLVILASYLHLQDSTWNPIFRWIPILSLSIYVFAYSIGVGPVPFVVMSEIFPSYIRGFALSKFQLLATILSFATIKTFPLFISLIGYHGCFLAYSFVCFLLIIFTFTNLPETKGRTLQDILEELSGDVASSKKEVLKLLTLKITK